MFTLHNGDCLDIMPTLEAGSIDAIITDLPYGTTACKWDTVIPFEPMWEQVKRVLKPNGVFITTASQPFTSALIMSNPEWFKCEWIWEKDNATAPSLAKKLPMKYHENCIVFGSGDITYNPQMWNAGRPSNKRGSSPRALAQGREKKYTGEQIFSNLRYPKSIIYFERPKWNNGQTHPTQKPVALYEYLIQTYTNEGETVLDICMGSGTTIEAAERTGRNSIGIEKDEGIFQSAVLRLKSLTPSNIRLHLTGGTAPAQGDLFTPEVCAGSLTPAQKTVTKSVDDYENQNYR
jgi:site-specific DNA-methyltransferase (adenine-specific)